MDIEKYKSLIRVIISYEDGVFLENEIEEFNSYLELVLLNHFMIIIILNILLKKLFLKEI